MTTQLHASALLEGIASSQIDSMWEQFTQEFPSDKACLDEICRRLMAEESPTCNCLDGVSRWKLKGRILSCKRCRLSFSITAGTFFDHMRRYKAWLAAIWFFERGLTINAVAFQKLAGVAYSSAKFILNKLMLVLHENMENKTVVVPSSSFVPVFWKRSRETAAREHPRSEEHHLQKAVSLRESSTESESSVQADHMEVVLGADLPQLCESAALLLKNLTVAPRNLSELGSLTGLRGGELQSGLSVLEIEGLCKRLPGNQVIALGTGCARIASQMPVRSLGLPCSGDDSTAIEVAVRNATQFIRLTYRGVSRKYLHFYLAAHWCFVYRDSRISGGLFRACIKFGKKTIREVFSQVAPLQVKMVAAA